MNNQKPIGIFDSGLGGLTVWKEVVNILPQENTIYLADSKNAPYGAKPKEVIIDLVRKNIDCLLDRGVKMVIMACNTASTQAADTVRKEYSIPIVALEPAIKPAALNSKSHKVGVLATQGTLKSEKFLNTSEPFRQNTEIFEIIGEGLVEAVENNCYESPEVRKLLKEYVKVLVDQGADSLVLGCTHYPFYKEQIQQEFPDLAIFDSGRAIANRAKDLLQQSGDLNENTIPGTHQIYTNGNLKILNSVLENANWNIPYTANYLEF